METALIILITGTLCMACFFVGAKSQQTVSKGDEIKIPEINPAKIMNGIKSNRENEEAKKEQERVDIILQNIENYDGTEMGQMDVPL